MVAQLETPNRTVPCKSYYKVEGLVQIFTSSQRTFFTNVMAQAMQISGQGTSVLVVQFLKGGINQGPKHPVRLGQHLDWVRCDLSCYIEKPEVSEKATNSIQELWQYCQKIVLEGKYSLVVLDELSTAINFGLIPEKEVVNLLDKRPRYVDIILTGPDMPDAILAKGDQITEIRQSYRS